MSGGEAAILVLVAVIGHLMALFWLCAESYDIDLGRDRIYALETSKTQIRRELKNSLHTPIHAAVLLVFLLAGFFDDRSLVGFLAALVLTAVWAEIWHYFSHRAFHWPALHWIHAEHHKSRISTPFTALSFSFPEKLIFDIGLIGGIALIDLVWSQNFFGVAMWFVLYLIVNSYGHSNFEIRSPGFMSWQGKFITSTVYHALHHSRYTGNYGLGTRFLDRLFGTEWDDSIAVFGRVVGKHQPLAQLNMKADPQDEPADR